MFKLAEQCGHMVDALLNGRFELEAANKENMNEQGKKRTKKMMEETIAHNRRMNLVEGNGETNYLSHHKMVRFILTNKSVQFKKIRIEKRKQYC